MTGSTFSDYENSNDNESRFSISAPELPSSDTIVNPVTGDRMTFLHASHQSQGTYAKISFDLPPGAKGSPLHYHTAMDETFTVIKGSLAMEVGKKDQWRQVQAGETVRVPAGMHHSFCNRSNDWVTFTTENRPSQGFEEFIRGLYGLAIDGKVNAAGIPTNLLQFALLLKKSDTIPVGVPPFLLGLVINSLVWIGQVFKIERSLTKYWS